MHLTNSRFIETHQIFLKPIIIADNNVYVITNTVITTKVSNFEQLILKANLFISMLKI